MTERDAAAPRAAAADWLLRQRDPGFDAWEAFTDWLEHDAANAVAYADLSVLDAELADDLARVPLTHRALDIVPALEPVRSRAPQRRWLAAALLAGAVTLGLLIIDPAGQGGAGSFYQVEAGSDPQVVSMPGGSRVVLQPGARVTLDRADPRYALLEHGTALFDIDHDSRRPYRVRFEGGEVVDVGTRFVVARAGGMTEVAVAEGSVEYRGYRTVPLGVGARLVTEGRRVVVGRVDAAAVAPWATTRLVYQDAPLERVGADLTRTLGIPVWVAPNLKTRRVDAVVRVRLGSREGVERIAALLGVAVRRERGGFLLFAG